MSNYKLSEQAMGAIMMALQKALMEQSDIVPVLQEMEWRPGPNGKLYVENSPIIDLSALKSEDEEG